METKKELKAFSGFTFKKILDSNIASLDEWPQMVKNIKKQLEAQDYDFSDWKEDEKGVYFGNQYVLKPKVKRETLGKVFFRSNDYCFLDCETDKKSFGCKLSEIKLLENGFKAYEFTYILQAN